MPCHGCPLAYGASRSGGFFSGPVTAVKSSLADWMLSSVTLLPAHSAAWKVCDRCLLLEAASALTVSRTLFVLFADPDDESLLAA